MYIVTSATNLLSDLRRSLKQAESRRDDPSNRQKDTTFCRGEVAALKHVIELCEALVAHERNNNPVS